MDFRRIAALSALGVSIAVLSASCGGAAARGVPGSRDPGPAYWLSGAGPEKDVLEDLFGLLEKRREAGEERFAALRQIADEYLKLKQYGKAAVFLSSWVDAHPDDPYDAYLLLMAAYAYLKEDAAPMAAWYFELILRNYPDLTVKGESVHLACLRNLAETAPSPERRARCLVQLIDRFPDKIDQGAAYFMLGKAREAQGDWDEALRAYAKFIPFYSAAVPGYPDAYDYAKRLVDFGNSPKDWTYASLPALADEARRALEAGDAQALRRLKAKVNFFALSWSQEASEGSQGEPNFAEALEGVRVKADKELDVRSNANEAFLRTRGWSQRVSTWYLYFRKIHFPAVPAVHGRWEWAGIYYGEKI